MKASDERRANKQIEPKFSGADRERIVCQLKALIRAEWPEEFSVKRANLKVVRPDGRMVSPKKQRRKNLARLKAARSAVNAGRKAGMARPMNDLPPLAVAKVLLFPRALTGDDLYEQWEWMNYNSHNWETTDAHGRKPFNKNIFAMLQGMTIADGKPPITDHTMRWDVKEGRTRIEKRNRVKAYLERRGINLDEVRNSEEALFRLFDLMDEEP